MTSTPTKECSAQEFFMDAIPDYAKCVAERDRLRAALERLAALNDSALAIEYVRGIARAALTTKEVA